MKREHQRRQQLENQLRFSQKLEVLGNLSGSLASDFDNLLGIIGGNVELARKDAGPTSPIQHNLDEIQLACTRARETVQHLSMFTPDRTSALRPVVAAELIHDSLRFLRIIIPPNITLITRVNLAQEMVMADPPQIYQALLNLISNAVQAMEDGGGSLTVAATAEEIEENQACRTGDLSPGGYVRITVADTGLGMGEAQLERIFTPYFTTRGDGKSTGMGLSIARNIVEGHGGRIDVESAVDKGSTFTIFLPVSTESGGKNS